MDDDFVVLHNGSDVSANISNVNDTYSVADVWITREAIDSVVTVFLFDITVTVTVAAGLPNFVQTLPQSAQETTSGLLGNFNGDETDDFVYPDGMTTLPNNATDRMIHMFGQQCKFICTDIIVEATAYLILCQCTGEILPEESLFTYPDGLSATNFSHPEHIPNFLDEVVSSTTDEIRSACNDNTQCIFDATETGDLAVGMATLQTSTSNTISFAQACKWYYS